MKILIKEKEWRGHYLMEREMIYSGFYVSFHQVMYAPFFLPYKDRHLPNTIVTPLPTRSGISYQIPHSHNRVSLTRSASGYTILSSYIYISYRRLTSSWEERCPFILFAQDVSCRNIPRFYATMQSWQETHLVYRRRLYAYVIHTSVSMLALCWKTLSINLHYIKVKE